MLVDKIIDFLNRSNIKVEMDNCFRVGKMWIKQVGCRFRLEETTMGLLKEVSVN